MVLVGGSEEAIEREMSVAGSLCGGVGPGNTDRGHLSHGVPPVPCGLCADRLRLRLYAQIGRR